MFGGSNLRDNWVWHCGTHGLLVRCCQFVGPAVTAIVSQFCCALLGLCLYNFCVCLHVHFFWWFACCVTLRCLYCTLSENGGKPFRKHFWDASASSEAATFAIKLCYSAPWMILSPPEASSFTVFHTYSNFNTLCLIALLGDSRARSGTKHVFFLLQYAWKWSRRCWWMLRSLVTLGSCFLSQNSRG